MGWVGLGYENWTHGHVCVDHDRTETECHVLSHVIVLESLANKSLYCCAGRSNALIVCYGAHGSVSEH